ncbi:Uu.00g058240.m01.CDS01 [Anthostomella pinea]|uniref:Uu.00g058240.m01.CDS01 n=1 Tax=Anthostomella pinea TaxID=933095 RepID=A0AAI8VSH0_9PEZI|nr:Uu.00g058240.m01.CDS01 [Anthostomella pinea]
MHFGITASSFLLFCAGALGSGDYKVSQYSSTDCSGNPIRVDANGDARILAGNTASLKFGQTDDSHVWQGFDGAVLDSVSGNCSGTQIWDDVADGCNKVPLENDDLSQKIVSCVMGADSPYA